MLNEYKEKVLAEFDDKMKNCKTFLTERDYYYNNSLHDYVKQFISDLIDDVVGAIPKEMIITGNESIGQDGYIKGYSRCRETLINNLNNK